MTLQERYAPSRPYRRGTQRRRALQGERKDGAGGRALAGRRAHSLDTDNLLATSVRSWLQDQETEWDRQESRERLWRRLKDTIYGIWQDKLTVLKAHPKDAADLFWWDAYEAEREAIREDRNPAYNEWLGKYIAKHGLPSCREGYLQCLYLSHWKRKHKPSGLARDVLRWEAQYFQLLNCQSEYIAYRANCCASRTEAVAVPIGCNHRLCPLCNWHRSQNSQRTVRKLYDRVEWPAFITLTVPNVKRISKRTFEHLRKRTKQFFAQHDYMFQGGVYAIESTYNRREKSWHVHVHALVSSNFRLPEKDQRIEFAGRNMPVFTYLKLALEYDWSRLWCKDFGKRWYFVPRKLARYSDDSRQRKEVLRFSRSCLNERAGFEEWVRSCHRNSIREYVAGAWKVRTDLSESELKVRTDWNLQNRRNLWIKRVDDRDRAVKEVLKYITKSADFIDDPAAVIAFYDASRGARLIQTFGSWYGVDFAVEFDTTHPQDWSKLECACGMNHWERIGCVQRKDVYMQAGGRWRLRRLLFDDSRWTFGRPRIRALERPEERNGEQIWTP
jgi:hypothetical protein